MITSLPKSNPQTITLALGSEGIKLCHSYWKLVCMEHGVSNLLTVASGLPKPPITHFHHSSSSQFQPRSLLVDIDDRTIQQIASSRWKHLHKHIPFPRDAPPRDSFPQCYDAVLKHSETINSYIFREVDLCDNLGRFIIFHSIAEASAAALFSFFCNYLSKKYPRVEIITFSLLVDSFPGPTPYNSTISLHFLTKYSKFSVLIPKKPKALPSLKPGVIQSFFCSTFTAPDRFYLSPGIGPAGSLEKLICRANPKMTQFAFPSLEILSTLKQLPPNTLTVIRTKDPAISASRKLCVNVTPGLLPQLFHLSYGVRFSFVQVLPEFKIISEYYKKIKLNNAFMQSFSGSPTHSKLLEDSYSSLAEFIARYKKMQK